MARPPSPPSKPATRSSTRIKPRPVARTAASAPVAPKPQVAQVPTRTASGTHRQIASPGPVNTDLDNVPFTIPTLFPIVPHPGETVESFVARHPNVDFGMYMPQSLGDSMPDRGEDTLSTVPVMAILAGFIRRRRELRADREVINAELAIVDENIRALQRVAADGHVYTDASNRRLQRHRILESDIVPASAVRVRVASGVNPRAPWAEATTGESSGASGGNAGASSQSQAIGIPVFLPQVVNVEPPKSPTKEQGKGDDEDDEESDSGSGSADGEGEEDDEEEGEEGDGEEGEESEDEEEEEAMVEG